MPSSTTFSPIERRDDFIPVIVGGDLGAYAVGREFYEAFGVRSYCIAPAPISAISRSANERISSIIGIHSWMWCHS